MLVQQRTTNRAKCSRAEPDGCTRPTGVAQWQEAGTVRLAAVEPLGVSLLSSATTWQPYARSLSEK